MELYFIYGLSIILFILVAIGVECNTEKSKRDFFSKEDSLSLRGVAAVMVVLGHSYQWMLGQEHYQGIIMKILGVFYSQLGGLAVMIFFFLSGYGIHKRYKKSVLRIDFIKKRLKSVYLEYLIIKLLFLLAEVIIGTISMVEISKRLLSIIAIEEWFVLVILIEYILYYICKKISEKRLILSLFLLNLIVAVGFWIVGCDDRYYNSLWLFLFGVVVVRYSEYFKRYIAKNKLNSLCLFVGFMLFGLLYFMYRDTISANLFKVFSGIMLCSFIMLLFWMISLKSTVLIWLGKNSLQLYIIHISLYELILRGYSYNLCVFLVVTFILQIVFVCLQQFRNRMRNVFNEEN